MYLSRYVTVTLRKKEEGAKEEGNRLQRLPDRPKQTKCATVDGGGWNHFATAEQKYYSAITAEAVYVGSSGIGQLTSV